MSASPDHDAIAPRRRVSPAGLALIRAFEGVCVEPQRLDEDHWVVGVSHVVAGPRPDPVDAATAERLLRDDLAPVEAAIDETVFAPLTQSQFDALACLAFNIGVEAFRRSTVVACLNEGRPLEAADGFDVWRWGEIDGRVGVLDAFVRRRAAEKALFLTPEAPVAAASTARRRPMEGGAAARPQPSAVHFANAPATAGGDVCATSAHREAYADARHGEYAVSAAAPALTSAPAPASAVIPSPGVGSPGPDDAGNVAAALRFDRAVAPDPFARPEDLWARTPQSPGRGVGERPRAWTAAAAGAPGAVDADGAEAALRARLQAGRERETTRWTWALAGIGGVLMLGGVYETASAGGEAGAWPAIAAAGALVAVASVYFAWRPQALWTPTAPPGSDAPP